MARGYTTRKLEVWSVHAHVDGKAADYTTLFDDLVAAPSSTRSFATNEKLVAMPALSVTDGIATAIAYEGTVGQNPLIFSSTSAEERVERLEAGEVVATKTHLLIDLELREAIVEYNHRGAKAGDVALLLAQAARSIPSWGTLELELNPVADREFSDAIDRFERIRIATLRIARPNFDWTDYKNKITGSAADSDAQSVELDFYAGRGNSLAKNRGAVAFLRRLISSERSILKNAAVTGTRTNESAETTISLGNYIAHQRVNVRMDEDGHVDDGDIDEKLHAFLIARQNQRSAETE